MPTTGTRPRKSTKRLTIGPWEVTARFNSHGQIDIVIRDHECKIVERVATGITVEYDEGAILVRYLNDSSPVAIVHM